MKDGKEKYLTMKKKVIIIVVATLAVVPVLVFGIVKLVKHFKHN